MTKFFKSLNILYERLLLIVLILILLIVMWCMYDNYYVFSHTSDKISGYRPGTVSTQSSGEKQITGDMVAWLTVDDTNIDYPIMQGSDNVKYLNTDPFGDYSLAGSIFLDSRCSSDFSDDYSLVYGHHMEYGRMFGALDDFLDENYLKAHRKGELMIGRDGEENHALTIFASVKASALDEQVFDPNKADVRSFIEEKADVKIGSTDDPRRILGLSTCTEGDSSARIIVFCYID